MSYTYGPAANNLMSATLNNRLPFIQRVYGLLLASVLWSVAVGALILNTPGQPIAGTDLVVPMGVVVANKFSFLIWIGLMVMLFLGRRIAQHPILGLGLLFTFTGIVGAWVTPTVWIMGVKNDQPHLVALAGALTTVTFVTLSAYVMLSRTNFSFLGAGLWVASLGLIAALLLNGLFFHSGWASTMLTWAILVFASGCVLYDTHRMLREIPDEGVVYATINLFVDILNLFLAILRLLGGNRR